MRTAWPIISYDRHWRRHCLRGTCQRLPPDLCLRRFDLCLPGLGPEPFTLAFFSDLHWDGQPAARLRRLVEAVNAAAADLVLFGGDLAAYLVDVPSALAQLGGLRARRACLAVRGNRESACAWLGPSFWRERYAEVGFRYLHNELWEDPADPAAPVLVGVDDQRHGDPDFQPAAQAAAAGRTVVTLTHNPDAVGHRDGAFLGHLVLSAHTHGGQYRLPGLGALFTSSRFWRQFDRGWRCHRQGALLYVTTGAGETGSGLLRRRLCCPPEVVLISLRGSASAAARPSREP
ncbi:MAG: hypothetical protein GX595_18505 [Lentisphaerae bacterium]|nr:hypothetical protein [Lentisphaerota bacterium]